MSIGQHRGNGRDSGGFFAKSDKPQGEMTIVSRLDDDPPRGPMGQLPDEEPTRAPYTHEQAGVIEGAVGRDMNFDPRLPSGAYPAFGDEDLSNAPANTQRMAAGITEYPPEPEVTPGNVDVSELVSCQAEFIDEQTRFLELGRDFKGEQYITALTLYSKAQGKLLKAQKDVLKQLGVI